MSVSLSPTTPADAAEVRERLEEALRLNLVGPGSDGPLAREELPGWVRPSSWYLTGFLSRPARGWSNARTTTPRTTP